MEDAVAEVVEGQVVVRVRGERRQQIVHRRQAPAECSRGRYGLRTEAPREVLEADILFARRFRLRHQSLDRRRSVPIAERKQPLEIVWIVHGALDQIVCEPRVGRVALGAKHLVAPLGLGDECRALGTRLGLLEHGLDRRNCPRVAAVLAAGLANLVTIGANFARAEHADMCVRNESEAVGCGATDVDAPGARLCIVHVEKIKVFKSLAVFFDADQGAIEDARFRGLVTGLASNGQRCEVRGRGGLRLLKLCGLDLHQQGGTMRVIHIDEPLFFGGQNDCLVGDEDLALGVHALGGQVAVQQGGTKTLATIYALAATTCKQLCLFIVAYRTNKDRRRGRMIRSRTHRPQRKFFFLFSL